MLVADFIFLQQLVLSLRRSLVRFFEKPCRVLVSFRLRGYGVLRVAQVLGPLAVSHMRAADAIPSFHLALRTRII